MMRTTINVKNGKSKGFTLVEVLVGMALLSVAVLGLAEMFLLCTLNNMRSDRMTTATYLAQEQVDSLRTLTAAELTALPAADTDQIIDINGDTVNDYRRITVVAAAGTSYQVRVLVFSSEHLLTPSATLLANPELNRVQAQVTTYISR